LLNKEARVPQRIAVIPGDGVGPEVIEIGLRVLDAAAPVDPDFEYETVAFPWGSPAR
jgi:tartrate dehydrogenase/decarboxylase / D-malate dehydrogenase